MVCIALWCTLCTITFFVGTCRAECRYTEEMLQTGKEPPLGDCGGPFSRLQAKRAALAEFSPCAMIQVAFAVDNGGGPLQCGNCRPGSTFAEDAACNTGEFCTDAGVCASVTTQPLFGAPCPFEEGGHTSRGWCGPGLRCLQGACSECFDGLVWLEPLMECRGGAWHPLPPPAAESSSSSGSALSSVMLVILALEVAAFSIYRSRKDSQRRAAGQTSSALASSREHTAPHGPAAEHSDVASPQRTANVRRSRSAPRLSRRSFDEATPSAPADYEVPVSVYPSRELPPRPTSFAGSAYQRQQSSSRNSHEPAVHPVDSMMNQRVAYRRAKPPARHPSENFYHPRESAMG